jgi:MscS family membrane protein
VFAQGQSSPTEGTGRTSQQVPAVDGPGLYHARTDSPRHTFASLLRLRDQLEATLENGVAERDSTRRERVELIAEELTSLLDLSQVPSAARRETGTETLGYLLDIFGRIALPDIADVPDATAFDADGAASYSIPDTPFRIVRMEEGAREGEFLFSERTIRAAPRFYRSIEFLPLRSSLPIGSWSTQIRQVTGPLIPAALVALVPDSWKRAALDTPLWKIATVGVLMVAAVAILVLWHRAVKRIVRGKRKAYLWLRILSPLAIIVVVLLLQDFVTYEVNVAGRFSRVADGIATALIYLAGTWAFWLFAVAVIEWIVLTPKFPEGSLDSSMLRLVARIIGTLGGIVILAVGAQEMGLPVLSLLAGLGIGGLAVALAIRPTLENLIGGFILFLDKPIRVGDFCTFGSQSGTVENIGVRSTQIRALDRTLISIPNAQFADMQIINWARCDEMLINETIGLRYETTTDQLRFVLVRIREMFHGHPRIDSDSTRVRLAGYGDSSIDISVRVYARTREWNDFFAIKEDVMFRIKDIVEQSGTGFAFPSQTLYLGKDQGVDVELGEKARQKVAEWRRAGQLPFPRFATTRLEQLEGRLSYPPRGSPDFNASEEELAETGDERLSADAQQDDSEALLPKSKEAYGLERK